LIPWSVAEQNFENSTKNAVSHYLPSIRGISIVPISMKSGSDENILIRLDD